MNILVAYFTQTGNTEKIAEAIYGEILSQGHDADLKRVEELVPDRLNDYDLVFLGSACHDTDLAKPVKRLLEKIATAPSFKLAGFVTHATYTPEGGDRQREVHEAWAGRCSQSYERVSRAKGIQWCGYFGCQGAPSAPIEAFIHQEIVTDAEEWEVYVAEVRQHPNEADKEKAREFTRGVLAQSLSGHSERWRG
jgi:flavodoxin